MRVVLGIMFFAFSFNALAQGCHHLATASCALEKNPGLKFFVAFNIEHACVSEFEILDKVTTVIDSKYGYYKGLCARPGELQNIKLKEYSETLQALRERVRLEKECFESSNKKSQCRGEVIRIK